MPGEKNRCKCQQSGDIKEGFSAGPTCGVPRSTRPPDRQQDAKEQFSDSGVSAVIDAVKVGTLEPHKGERCKCDDDTSAGKETSATNAHEYDNHYGEHKVELLFDGERPKMLQRSRLRKEIPVADSRRPQMPVRHVSKRRQHVAAH